MLIFCRNSTRAPQQELDQAIKNIEPKVPASVISQAELTSFMAAGINHLSDISRVLENSAQFDMSQMRLAYAIANSADTKAWLYETGGILVLNGSGDTTVARQSPISASLASLVFGITDDPNAIVIHFFCGLHSEASKPISGPKGLVRSLIAQLSLKHDFNLTFIDNEAYREGIRDHDMRTLCETFSAMVAQLPAICTLHCIIDGISWLDTSHWRGDFAATIAYICYLSVDPQCQARFRLLISSPTRNFALTQELRQYGELVNVVDVGSIKVTERDMPMERELAQRIHRYI
jgi:hypothetical protein